jgi:hypothetical protein
MRYTILIAIFSFIFISCNKNKFSTAPQIEYKSVNTNVLDREQILEFTFSFTDAEGDVDSFFVRQVNPKCNLSNFRDSAPLPTFPATKKFKGDLIVSYSYSLPGIQQLQEPQCDFNDTCYFQFYLKDKKGNVSDSANSEQIVIIKH